MIARAVPFLLLAGLALLPACDDSEKRFVAASNQAVEALENLLDTRAPDILERIDRQAKTGFFPPPIACKLGGGGKLASRGASAHPCIQDFRKTC